MLLTPFAPEASLYNRSMPASGLSIVSQHEMTMSDVTVTTFLIIDAVGGGKRAANRD